MAVKKLPTFEDREAQRSSVVRDMIGIRLGVDENEAVQAQAGAQAVTVKGGKLRQKSYYITEDQHRALRKKAYEDDVDMSSIVRAALNAYLGISE